MFFGLIPVKALAVDLLRLNTLRGTKTAFLTPKRYNEEPHLFIWEFTPWKGVLINIFWSDDQSV